MIPKYSMRIAWYPEDKCFVGICPEFPSISACDESYIKVAKELEIVIQLAVEVFEDVFGKKLPDPIFADPDKAW